MLFCPNTVRIQFKYAHATNPGTTHAQQMHFFVSIQIHLNPAQFSASIQQTLRSNCSL